MNVLVLLGGVALLSCALGVLGLTRVGKSRRQSLKSYERTCLLDPLSLPPPHVRQQPQQDTSALFLTAARSLAFVASLIPRALLAPLQPLVQTALRISGLSLLMANHQHDARQPAAVATMNARSKRTHDAAEQSTQTKDAPLTSQTTWSEDDYDGDDAEEFDADSFEDDDAGVSTPRDDASGDGASDGDDEDEEEEIFEDTCEDEQGDDDAEAVAAESDAQRALFDGLQFYTVLTQVGAATVSAVVQQAVRNAVEATALQRVRDQQKASISAIEQRYPDIMCLSAPSYMQHTTRADLATALLAVTTAAAAAAAMQSQQQQQAQQCGTMERRLSIKRPESLALAAEDGMEPMRRTPLTSPAGGSANPLEPSFLQAA